MTEEKVQIPRRVEIAFVVMVILFFLILCAFAWVITDIRDLSSDAKDNSDQTKTLAVQTKKLVGENRTRISEIQQSRIDSCKQTYLSIRNVFKPFFPSASRTTEGKANLDRFNRQIDNLRRQCTKQTKPKPKESTDESQ